MDQYLLSGACLALLLCCSCGDESIEHKSVNDSAPADLGPDNNEGDAAQPDSRSNAMLRILVEGDLTETASDDGLAGQTPKVFVMGLERFEVLRSANDTEPLTIFDHRQKPVLVDMFDRTEVGSAKLAELEQGTFTHGRAKLTMIQTTVEATVHIGAALAGELTVLGALSSTQIDGEPYDKGQAKYTFKAGVVEQSFGAILPPLPPTGGGIVEEDEATWLVFAFPDPLEIYPDADDDISATIVYKLHEAFRWRDIEQKGFTDGVFDISAATSKTDEIVNFGVTSYAIVIKP